MSVPRKKSVGIVVNHDVQKPFVIEPPSPSPDITGSMDRYDLATLTWSNKKSMNDGRAGFAMHAYGEYLYAIGGTNGAAVLETVEEYDSYTDDWVFKSNMPTPRAYMQSVERDGYIYCIGGITASSIGSTIISRSVERYDIVNDSWEQLSPLPDGMGIMMGIAHVVNDKIYVLCGYANQYSTYNDSVLIYDIALDTWQASPVAQLSATERLMPFSFVNNGLIYLSDGVSYTSKSPLTYLSDAWKYDTATGTFTKADRDYHDLPKSRYAGQSIVADKVYCVGGVSQTSNTLRVFESLDTNTSPFSYALLSPMPRGRSSFGACSTSADYGDAIYVAGGVVSRPGTNFLKVDVEAVPSTIRLDGKQTCAINIVVSDENGDAPTDVNVRLAATVTNDSSSVVLFTEDQLLVKNGFGMATLIGRSDDSSGSISMDDSANRDYIVSVSASIIDPHFFGDTEPVLDLPSSSGSINGGGSTLHTVPLPSDVKFIQYNSVTSASQASSGSFVKLSNVGGFLSLTPTVLGGGESTTVNYYSDVRWIPIVDRVIDNNEGSYDDIKDALDRLSRALPFGGSPMVDAVYQAGVTLEFDSTNVKKLVYVQTDGDDRNSHNSVDSATQIFDALSNGRPPVVSSIYRVVPSNLHLDQGVRNPSIVADQFAKATGASTLYVTSENDIDRSVLAVITSPGFIGSGKYSCEIDLGEEVKIEQIVGNFSILDSLSFGYYRYALAGEDRRFSLLSDRNNGNIPVILTDSVARYVRFVAEFTMEMGLDTYDATHIIPPALTSIDITYHHKTESYIFWNSETAVSEPHQVAISIDSIRYPGSEINVGVNTAQTAMWEDYDKPASPAMENDSRVVVPIRRTLANTDAFTLEKLLPVDGFIFEARYGRWSEDAVVNVYVANQNEPVDPTTYRAFPDKGYIVFNTRTNLDYVLYIENRPKLAVATKIVNRVSGSPVVIKGAGYMYSTLESKARTSQGTSTLPEAINLMVTPLQPDVNSVFTANYGFYDLSGRAETGSLIRWYINGVLQSDINDLKQWDNKEWKLAQVGSSVYFTVEPHNDRFAGRVVRSLPVVLAG